MSSQPLTSSRTSSPRDNYDAIQDLAERIVAIARGGDFPDRSSSNGISALSDPLPEAHLSRSAPVKLVRRSVSLPDPRLIRRMIRLRQKRRAYFDGDLFADPAWDMLLDLAAARAEHKRVSVTSLCIASGVPSTTALRWIQVMSDAGLFIRTQDDLDRRRSFIELSDKAARAMAELLRDLSFGVSPI